MHTQSGRGASHEALARSKPRLESVHESIGDPGCVGVDGRQDSFVTDTSISGRTSACKRIGTRCSPITLMGS